MTIEAMKQALGFLRRQEIARNDKMAGHYADLLSAAITQAEQVGDVRACDDDAPKPGDVIRRISVDNLKTIYRNGAPVVMLAALGNCIAAIEDAKQVLGAIDSARGARGAGEV